MLCVGVLGVMLRVDQANRLLYGRTVAYRAAHQTLEILLAEDMDLMLLQDGNRFAILVDRWGNETGDVTFGTAEEIEAAQAAGDYTKVLGTITMTDLNWIGVDNAYEIRVEVLDLGIVLSGVRARA